MSNMCKNKLMSSERIKKNKQKCYLKMLQRKYYLNVVMEECLQNNRSLNVNEFCSCYNLIYIILWILECSGNFQGILFLFLTFFLFFLFTFLFIILVWALIIYFFITYLEINSPYFGMKLSNDKTHDSVIIYIQSRWR